MTHSKLPWRITDATEKKTREIVDANGATVAKLTALDMANALLIVSGVNAADYILELKAALRRAQGALISCTTLRNDVPYYFSEDKVKDALSAINSALDDTGQFEDAATYMEATREQFVANAEKAKRHLQETESGALAGPVEEIRDV